MAKKKKRSGPPDDAAKNGSGCGRANACVALGLLGILATLLWPAAAVLDALAVFLGRLILSDAGPGRAWFWVRSGCRLSRRCSSC